MSLLFVHRFKICFLGNGDWRDEDDDDDNHNEDEEEEHDEESNDGVYHIFEAHLSLEELEFDVVRNLKVLLYIFNYISSCDLLI